MNIAIYEPLVLLITPDCDLYLPKDKVSNFHIFETDNNMTPRTFFVESDTVIDTIYKEKYYVCDVHNLYMLKADGAIPINYTVSDGAVSTHLGEYLEADITITDEIVPYLGAELCKDRETFRSLMRKLYAN